jgi:hypothetical protein
MGLALPHPRDCVGVTVALGVTSVCKHKTHRLAQTLHHKPVHTTLESFNKYNSEITKSYANPLFRAAGYNAIFKLAFSSFLLDADFSFFLEVSFITHPTGTRRPALARRPPQGPRRQGPWSTPIQEPRQSSD